MAGILGKKLGMTRLFDDEGRTIPITVVKCNPNEITQVKTSEKDGYSAVVLGFIEAKKPKKTKRFVHIKEFKIDSEKDYKKGDNITLEYFKEVEKVKISAISKGKGFQGVIKRYNFSRGPETHGSHHHRRPGSIGACAKPGRVNKGKKLPGRMGNAKVTINNVKVIHLDTDQNIICLKGAIPGPIGGLVSITKLA